MGQTRTITDALAATLPPERYRVSQDREGRVTLELAPGERAEPPRRDASELIRRPVSIGPTLAPPSESAEKTHPVRSEWPAGAALAQSFDDGLSNAPVRERASTQRFSLRFDSTAFRNS